MNERLKVASESLIDVCQTVAVNPTCSEVLLCDMEHLKYNIDGQIWKRIPKTA